MARRRPADDADDAPDDAEVLVAKPRNDAYVGLLAITFLALATAAGLIYTDAESLAAQSLSPPTFSVPPLGSATAPAGS